MPGLIRGLGVGVCIGMGTGVGVAVGVGVLVAVMVAVRASIAIAQSSSAQIAAKRIRMIPFSMRPPKQTLVRSLAASKVILSGIRQERRDQAISKCA